MLTETEQTLFGCMLYNHQIVQLWSGLTDKHFDTQLKYKIYQTLLDTDPVSDFLTLAKNKQLTREEFVFTLDFGLLPEQCSPQVGDRAYRKIKETTNLESLKKRISDVLVDGTLTTKELTDNVLRIANNANINDDIEMDSMSELIQIYDKASELELSGVEFGFKQIDRHIAAEKNCLIVIGARPFSGKTTFAVNVAMHNAIKHKVIYFSLEMGRFQIASKCLKYGQAYNSDNLYVIEKPSLTMPELFRIAHREKPGLIIIDQLNKINIQGKSEYERFTNSTRALKIATAELGVPIIVLAQINRSAENNVPYMHQIKGSGSAEEEADIVALLYIKDYKTFITNVYIGKNRTLEGKLLSCDLRYNPETMFYKEV